MKFYKSLLLVQVSGTMVSRWQLAMSRTRLLGAKLEPDFSDKKITKTLIVFDYIRMYTIFFTTTMGEISLDKFNFKILITFYIHELRESLHFPMRGIQNSTAVRGTCLVCILARSD